METENTNTDTTVKTEPQTNTDTPTPEAPPTSGIPEYTPQAFAELNAAYALVAPAEPKEAEPGEPTEAGADYSLTFPETFAEHPEAAAFNSILAPIAKESGMDGERFGKVFAEAYSAITEAQQRAEWQNRFRQDEELKKDWGAAYEANMETARGHIAFLKERAGLSDEDLAVFSSPKGMRALYAMATAHATPPAAGLDMGSVTEQTWARAVLQPGHADHEAFINPLNPRYKEVNQRWLRANGQ